MLFYQGFFIFIWMIDVHILILVVFAQIFNPVPKLVIPIVIQTKEAKSEMETHQVIVKAKTKKKFNII